MYTLERLAKKRSSLERYSSIRFSYGRTVCREIVCTFLFKRGLVSQ